MSMGRLGHGFLKLFSGSVLSQVINLASIPFLARIYSPEQFGHFAVYVAVATVLTLLIGGRGDMAMVVASRGRHARLIFANSLYLAIGAGLILMVFLSVIPIDNLLGERTWLLLPLGSVSFVVYNLICAHFNYHRRYGSLSIATMVRVCLWVLLAFVFQEQDNGLVWSFIGAYVLFGFLYISVVFSNLVNPFTHLKKGRWVFEKNKDFLKYNTPHAVLNNLNLYMPVYLLGLYGYMQTLGAFSQANRLVYTPCQIISSSLYRVLYKEAAESHLRVNMRINWVVLGLYTFSLLIGFGILYGFVEPIVVLVLGSQWLFATDIIIALLPWFFSRALGSVFAFATIVASKQKLALYLEVFYCVVVFLALVVGNHFFGDGSGLLWLVSVTASVVVLGQLIWYFTLLSGVARRDVAKAC